MSLFIRSEEEKDSKPVRFRKSGRLHYSVELFLGEESPGELDQVKEVEYELHPSFKDRYRTSRSRNDCFRTKIRTYGLFDLKARIYFKDGAKEEIEGRVDF